MSVPPLFTRVAAPEGSLRGTVTQPICSLSGVDERSVVPTDDVGDGGDERAKRPSGGALPSVGRSLAGPAGLLTARLWVLSPQGTPRPGH